MDKFGELRFSLTKEDINLLLDDKNKIKRKIKYLDYSINVSLVLLISINVVGFFLSNPLLFYGSLFGGGSTLRILNNKLKTNIFKLNQYNTKMEQLKIDFQRLVGPNRIVNGKSFRLEKSNNVVKNLTKYSFEKREITPNCGVTSERIVNDNLSIGTVSRQYVAVDDNGIVGAINELKLSDVERSATENGCVEKIVTEYEYSLCGADEVRPYEPEVSVKKRTRKPQGR